MYCNVLYLTDPNSRKLAMLIDGDNVEARRLGKILEETSKHGTVTIRRIYGNWINPQMSQWVNVANKHAFQTPHQLNYTKGKNTTDTFLIIDAMDILHSGHVDGFCIVSSDSDFTGLAKRIREQGMFVMGMGKETTPESFKNACEIFTHVEILTDQPSIVVTEEQHGQDRISVTPANTGITEGAQAESYSKTNLPDWKDIVINAIDMAEDEEWARLADVGNNIRKLDSSFDTRRYGNKTLLLLVKTAPDRFEIQKKTEGGHLPVHYIRAVPK